MFIYQHPSIVLPALAPIFAPESASAILPLLLFNQEDLKSPPAKSPIVLTVFLLHFLFEINLLSFVLPVIFILLLRFGALNLELRLQ